MQNLPMEIQFLTGTIPGAEYADVQLVHVKNPYLMCVSCEKPVSIQKWISKIAAHWLVN